ncbi:MAG: hypothetical protein Q8O30_04465 [Candidatus Omnitrophota bacterium]|nr:hypothetical protein [Candidatus Omnitrophota bacterium]
MSYIKIMEENIKPKKKWGARKIVSLILFVIILSAVVYYAGIQYSEWWKVRKQYIDMGFASDKFPYRMFTERELVEKGIWPVESQELINTPTRTRPEQTYAIFRQALVDDDMDVAAGCFIKEKVDEWKKSLYEIKEKGYLPEMLSDLPEKLEDTYIYTDDATGKDTKSRDLDHTAMSSYDYITEKNGKNYSHVISFIKNWDGDWKIEYL